MEKVERQKFSDEEKIKILHKSNNKCAHCFKPLTLKNMTVEHMYPIDKGGDNSEYNIIALCETCNKEKSNFVYDLTYFSGIKKEYQPMFARELLKKIYANCSDTHILGRNTRVIHAIDNKMYDMLYSKHNKKFKNKVLEIGRALSRRIEVRELLAGDFDEDFLSLLAQAYIHKSLVNDEYVVSDDIIKINKYILINMIQFCTFYGAYYNGKIKAIYCYSNMDNFEIDEDFLNDIKSRGFNKVYLNLIALCSPEFSGIGYSINSLICEFMATTNNLVILSGDYMTMKDIFKSTLNGNKCFILRDDRLQFIVCDEETADLSFSFILDDDNYKISVNNAKKLRESIELIEEVHNEES